MFISKWRISTPEQKKVFENEARSFSDKCDIEKEFNNCFASYKATRLRSLKVDEIAEIAGNYFIWKEKYGL